MHTRRKTQREWYPFVPLPLELNLQLLPAKKAVLTSTHFGAQFPPYSYPKFLSTLPPLGYKNREAGGSRLPARFPSVEDNLQELQTRTR